MVQSPWTLGGTAVTIRQLFQHRPFGLAATFFSLSAAQSLLSVSFAMPRFTGVIRYLVPLILLGGLCVVFVEVPPAAMDILVALNITVAVMIFMTSFTVVRPLEFSVFPSILLATTILRLCLNIATTRMILTHASSSGIEAAGSIIATFGRQVTGDQLIVGLTIFAILVVVQLIVVTQGAARISEVAARFTLDGLPGKQMTIDSDLAAGLIDKHEAQLRRQDLIRQTDFFGAMDGASKFLRGEAMACVVITVVNLTGGLYRGVIQEGMNLSRAIDVYSKLTIGDGLASQIPSVLVALAAGMLISRCSERMNFSRELLAQTVANQGTAWAVAAVLIVLAFCGMPAVPMVSLAIGIVAASWGLRQQLPKESPSAISPRSTTPAAASPDQLVGYDPLELELGLRLLPLAKEEAQPNLLAGLSQLRQRFATEFGLVVPRIRVRDHLKLAPNEFCLKVLGNQVCYGRIEPQGLLAVAPSAMATPLRGQSARGLVSEMSQWWIEESERARAIADGYTVFTPSEALLEAVYRAIRRHADEILTRDAVKGLLQAARKVVPTVVDEVSTGNISLGTIQKVLQQLVRERIPLKQLPRILEAICDCAGTSADTLELTEAIRERIAGSISAAFRDRDGRLRCARLSPDLEHTLREAVESGMHVRPSSELQNLVRNICRELERQMAVLKSTGLPQVLVVPQPLRHYVAQWSGAGIPDLIVLGDREITVDTQLVQVATIGAMAVAA